MTSRLSTQLSGVALTARSRVASRAVALAAVIAASSATCSAAPQFSLLTPLTTASPTAVASALFAGRTGAASTSDDTVEVRDAEGVLLASVTSARIAALMPWATFGGGAALAF